MTLTAPLLPQATPERTKTRLLELVKRHGAQTAQELAAGLEVTVPAARRHLNDLMEQGVLSARTERPGGRGRPQQVFVLTERGEATFPKTYSTLCLDVLRHVEDLFGQGALLKVLDARSAELARQLQPELPAHLPLPERLERLAARLNELGFHAEVERRGEEFFLVQRNCPNLTVARQYHQLCASELEMYTTMLGVPVRRDSRIACGQGTCRYQFG